MPGEIEVSCPGCNAVFTVPSELAGEIAECSECGAVFEIPKIDEVAQSSDTETGAIKGKITEEAETATNTVKLSRTSIGMIPTLKDSFTFGDPKAPASAPQSRPPFAQPQRPAFAPPPAQQRPPFTPPQTPPPPTQQTQRPPVSPQQQPPQAQFPIPPATAAPPVQQVQTPSIESPQFKTHITPHAAPPPPPPRPSTPPPVSSPPPRPPSAMTSSQKPSFTAPQQVTPQTATTTTPPSSTQRSAQIQPQLPPWTKIILKPDEQVFGFREIQSNPVGIGIGTSFPILICLLSVYLAKPNAIISYIIVVAVWLLSFIIITAVATKNTKTFIAFTSHRAILIIGSKRFEINK